MNVEPSAKLIDDLSGLAEACLVMAQNNRVLHIQLDAEAQKFADDFEKTTTDNINHSDVQIAKELWNRAHLKMLKLSALIALGLNPYEPVVTLDCIKWAHILVNRDVENAFARFESGKIGKSTNEAHQIEEIRSVVREYLYSAYNETLRKYLVDPRMHADKVVPLAYLQRRCQAKNAFRNDRLGATISIKRSVEFLVTDGAMQEVRGMDMHARYQKSMKAYMVTDLSRFQERS